MRILLLNDTSKYHSGCKQVIKNLKLQMQPHTAVVSIPVTVPYIQYNDWDNIDAVVVNGEGTMHNNRQGAVSLLNFVNLAQQQNKPTVLLNSIWQNMDTSWKSVTDNLQQWSVRDVYSQQHAQHDFGRTPDLCPDISYINCPDVSTVETQHNITLGQYAFDSVHNHTKHTQRINIFKQSWHDVVNQLRNSNLCVTGRFHEVMACICAETPFVAVEGNSWKMQALIASAGADIPVLNDFPTDLQDVEHFSRTYHLEYAKVFKWHKQTISKFSLTL
jgi:polysaccharide pyruvyl transferase WcaK-like protein